MKSKEVPPVQARTNSYSFFLFIFFISGCGVFPGKSNRESAMQPIAWEQLCFSPQGRARLSQGSEKTLASLEGQFLPLEKKWAVAFSAPIYGERVFRLDWSEGKMELSSDDLQALGWDKKQRSSVLEMSKFMASVLQTSIDKKCGLSLSHGRVVGECPAPASGLPAFQFLLTQQGIEFFYETQHHHKVVWSHVLSGAINSASEKQVISFFQNTKADVSPAWSLELFLNRCGENEPVQNP